MATDSPTPSGPETHLRLSKPIDQRPEFNGQVNWQRRKDRERWLTNWAHIWTKRQSPEWKPRRASVASCQQQSNYHQQAFKGFEDSFAGYRPFNDPDLNNLTTPHPLFTTFSPQSRHSVSQHCPQPEDAKLIKVNKLNDSRSLSVAENPTRKSSLANHCQEIPLQNKTTQQEQQICVVAKNKKESESSRTITSYGVPTESGIIRATTLKTASEHEGIDLRTTSSVELEGSTPLDHSSLLSLSKGEGSQPTTCCPESYSPSDLACTSIENTTTLGMNENFQLQEKQRKLLISSMALKWVASDRGLATECHNCRSKSFFSGPSQVPRLQLRSDARHLVGSSKISANNLSSTFPDRLLSNPATRLVCCPELGQKDYRTVGVSGNEIFSAEHERMHTDVKDVQRQKDSREYNNLDEEQDFCLLELGIGSRDKESVKTMGQTRCDMSMRRLERVAGEEKSMIGRQRSPACANCCLSIDRRDFGSDTESEDMNEHAPITRITTKRHREESSIPQEHFREQHHKHCGSEASLENEDSYDFESLIVESWLDDHPNFVHDYFLRKASRRMIDDWLITHAKVSNTNSGSQLDLVMSKSQLPVSSHLLQSGRRSGNSSPKTQGTIIEFMASDLSHPSSSFPVTRSNSQSGYKTPVRKISATDFESRTGSALLRPMVSTAPDGRPTFLSQEIKNYIDRDEGEKNLDNRLTKSEDSDANSRLSDNIKIGDKNTVNDTCANTESGKESEEVELIFELVKNICNDLDIRTLLHTILKNIAVLINADKSSLFLVSGQPNDPNRTLVSQLFNVDQDSEIDEPEDCITIPWGTGLVGYVAESGESVNIANCYEDPRFTDTIDQRTGYVTRHMLCGPIFDKRNEIVGVAQVINKRDGNPFSESDEMKFKRYLQFCGIGLRNAQSYEHCQLENRRNQVLLDLARMVFEEQSTIEQVVYRIMLHTQSLLECQRCQVLLIDDGSDDLDQLLQLTSTSCKAGGPTNNANMNGPKPRWRPHFRANQDQEVSPDNRSPSPAERSDDDMTDECSPLDESAEQLVSSSPPQQQSTKLFSLVFDLECDGNDLVMSSNKKCSEITGKKRPFPINIGITGYVAMTGETLNIEDAHQCERFDPSVDEDSNFRHKSILCMPIRNGQRQIIGVSQLINKRNGRAFNKNDEDLFEAFAIFCGLGIHNTLMYERVLKIMAKQRVTFEVLSYHATAPLEEAKKLNNEPIPSCFALNLTSLKFNDFSLDEQFMLKSCLRFFIDLDLIRRFQIDQLVFCNWILSVQKNYRKVTYHPIVGGTGLKASPVRYHNWRHAFNVSQMMFAILINTQICPTLGELETLALLIACLCHDLDHRGTNNSFQIKSASPLAELYSTSTMEHHHFDQCIMILNSQGNQILANLSPDEYSRVIVLLEEAILATDLANYFQKRELFFQLVNSNQFDWHQNQEHRSLLRCMLMTACDVAAITKPWPVQKVVADLVMSEFHQQGDIEKNELNIEPIDLMNRDKMSKLPEMQIGFIDSICAPMYSAFARLFPCELSPLLDGCLSNRTLWTELASKNQAKSTNLELAGLLNNNNGTVQSKFLAKNSAKPINSSSSETNLRMHSVGEGNDDNRGSDFIDCMMSKSNEEHSNSSYELTKAGCQRKSI